MQPRIDFFERLEGYAGERPNDIALQCLRGERRDPLTWRELVDDVRRVSLQINRIVDSRAGAHVGLLMEDSAQWGVAFIAAYSAGCVILPLDPSQDVAVSGQIVADGECAALIFSATCSAAACQIKKTTPGLNLLGFPGGRTEGANALLPLVNRDPNADLAIFYTGGTTGYPKGVRMTEANLFWSIRDMLAVCPITAVDHILSILPLFHIMALLANLLGPLYVGARVTYLSGRDPARVLAAFHDEGITAFLCVPQFYYLLVRRIIQQVDAQPTLKRFVFYRLLSLSRFLRRRMKIQTGRLLFRQIHDRFGPKFRLFGVGAASFSADHGETMLDLGFNLFQAYGMTETGGPVTVDPPGANGGLTCGPPMPHARIRIHNPDGDGVGEILVAGEHVTPGYWKQAEATAELIRDGWLWSGDLGFLDSNGRLHVTGRKKEVIVLSSGKNVFPEEVEYRLQKGSEFIREVCVLGLPSSSGDEQRLHAIIVPDFDRLKEQGVTNVQDRIRYDIENASRSMVSWQHVHGFEIRATPLPRTSTRKLKRFEVQRGDVDRRSGNSEARDEEPEVFELIRRAKKNCGPLHVDSHLELDLGFDSLERVELLSNIRARFGIEISDEQAGKIFRAGDLAKLLDKVVPAKGDDWVSWPEILRAPLSDKEKHIASLYLRRRPMFDWAIFMVCRLAGFAAGFLLNMKVTGIEEIPREYPFVICSNHASYVDALLIASVLPFRVFRRLFFLGASKYARAPVQRWLARMMHSVSVDAGAQAGSALRLAAEGLQNGLVLCVFPEGHRSIDGALLPFHNGPSILAIEKGLPILPVGLIGTQNVWGRASRQVRLSAVEVRFGRPIDSTARPDYEQLTRLLRETVSQLITS
jgi:long-chain acyl-CoA synthetase